MNPESHTPYAPEPANPFSISHLVHTVRKYSTVIIVSMIAVMILYAIAALAYYLRTPSRRVTSLQFRLIFAGANTGKYPNGLGFAPADITDTPVLLGVYRANHLEQFIPFEVFSSSVFVTSVNFEYQLLAMQYDARLSDPKLSPIDRDRIEREYQHKRDSLSKSDYAIAFTHQPGTDIPMQVTRKVLSDILAAWARRAVYDRRIMLYPVNVMSTKVLDRSILEKNDYVIALAVLRNRVSELIANVDLLQSTLPGVSQVRTHDQLSLAEIEVQLEDLLRFQIDPLITTARSSGMVKNAGFDVRVLEAQLAYNQRRLDAAKAKEAAIRNSFAAYEQAAVQETAGTVANGTQQQATRGTGQAEAIVSDSFLDRIVDLAGREADREFRQKMVRDMQKAAMDVIPAQEAVSYSSQLLADFKAGTPMPSNDATEQLLRNGSDEAYKALQTAIDRVYEIYTTASKLTNPATQIYTENGAPATRIDRTVSVFRLILYGMLVFFMTLPVVIILALLHNRVREEEEEERALTPAA